MTDTAKVTVSAMTAGLPARPPVDEGLADRLLGRAQAEGSDRRHG
jgi:hypothetical protein